MNKTRLITTLFVLICQLGHAQTVTPKLTVYPDFRPATAYMNNGKKVKIPLANIFLKNSTLLYNSGLVTKEADARQILKVEFSDRTYIRIDSMLCYPVDTVGTNILYCAKKIDMDAFRQSRANNASITNLNITDMLSYSTIDMEDPQDIHFPIIPIFYYKLGDKFVLVHERHLKRVLDKEHKRLMASVMSQDGFSWTDEESLIKLLRILTPGGGK